MIIKPLIFYVPIIIKNFLSGGLTCRQVLNIMVIIGFMINYMLRVNLTIAMVAMVYPSNHSHSNLTIASANAILSNKTGNIPVRNSSNGIPLQLVRYLD